MSKKITECWNCEHKIEFTTENILELLKGNLPKLESGAIVIANLEDIDTKLRNYFEQFGQQYNILGQRNKLIFPCPNCGELNKED